MFLVASQRDALLGCAGLRLLYAVLGYDEVPAFNDSQYAEHWLAKPLAQSPLAQGCASSDDPAAGRAPQTAQAQ